MIQREIFGGEEWEVDFSGAWVLGGFDDEDEGVWDLDGGGGRDDGGGDGGGDGKGGYGGVGGAGEKGWDGKVDLNYVLARQNVWARTVYPAVGAAIREGLILGV